MRNYVNFNRAVKSLLLVILMLFTLTASAQNEILSNHLMHLSYDVQSFETGTPLELVECQIPDLDTYLCALTSFPDEYMFRVFQRNVGNLHYYEPLGWTTFKFDVTTNLNAAEYWQLETHENIIQTSVQTEGITYSIAAIPYIFHYAPDNIDFPYALLVIYEGIWY